VFFVFSISFDPDFHKLHSDSWDTCTTSKKCISTILFRTNNTVKRLPYSGAGTILGQGGQDRERQSREREIKFFAICLFPKNKRSPKNKKKGFRRIRSVFLSQNKRSLKKGLRRIRSVFLSQKWLRIQVSGRAKVSQGGQNISRGAAAPCLPTFRTYVTLFFPAQKIIMTERIFKYEQIMTERIFKYEYSNMNERSMHQNLA